MMMQGTDLTSDARVILTNDARVVLVRPIRASDAERVHQMLLRSSPQTRYRRFHAPLPRVTRRFVDRLTDLDGERAGGLIAIASGDIIAMAHFGTTVDGATEVAVVVEDTWQGRGLGTSLLSLIFDEAAARGARTITGTVLRDNEVMVHLLEQLPASARHTFDGPLRTFWFDVGASDAGSAGHAA